MDWQPIETAPKGERSLLLFFPAGWGPLIGQWNDDRYAKTPRPYWTHDQVRWRGVADTRANQPTHWMPLPPEPA